MKNSQWFIIDFGNGAETVRVNLDSVKLMRSYLNRLDSCIQLIYNDGTSDLTLNQWSEVNMLCKPLKERQVKITSDKINQ